MASNTQTQPGGIGFAGLLAIIFIGLKLGGVIAWSWWWVLSPLWISAALWVAFVVTIVGIVWLLDR